MCDYIEPVGELKKDTFLVLKQGKTVHTSPFTAKERKDISLIYEWAYYISFHLGPEWRFGALYTKGSSIPEDADYDAFDDFFAICGQIVLNADGIHRLVDYRRKEGVLTTYGVDYFEKALFEANIDTIDRAVKTFRFLEESFMIVKYYRSFPKDYSSLEEYFRDIEATLELYPESVFPKSKFSACDDESFSIAMEYWPIVVYKDTPFYKDRSYKKVYTDLVSNLSYLDPLPGTWMRFRSDSFIKKAGAKAVFMDPEFFVDAGKLLPYLESENPTSEELARLYMPTYADYDEVIL